MRAACYATDNYGKTGLDYADETNDEEYGKFINEII